MLKTEVKSAYNDGYKDAVGDIMTELMDNAHSIEREATRWEEEGKDNLAKGFRRGANLRREIVAELATRLAGLEDE